MLLYNINFITLQVVSAAGVTNSYINFLTKVVLKIHIYYVIIYKCSFLTFQTRQYSKNHAQNHDRFIFFVKIQQGYLNSVCRNITETNNRGNVLT